mgnify:FL=1|jgi:hypothetical protein|tara:strand:- start:1329 stop:1697 length:369 start_codon:yes stop_codon:yes gene_type:complete
MLNTKFKDFVQQLNEDDMIPDTKRDMLGLKDESLPNPTNVNDYFRSKERTDVAPENVPYPLGEVSNMTSNAFIALQNLEGLLKIAKTNAVIKDKTLIDVVEKKVLKLKKDIVDIDFLSTKIK